MNSVIHSIGLIAVAAIVTLGLRAFPFLIFGKKNTMPPSIEEISKLLPVAIMAVLVVYCLKDSIYDFASHFFYVRDKAINLTEIVATILAVISVLFLHLWKRHTLLSVFIGTAVYMIIIRIFPMINLMV